MRLIIILASVLLMTSCMQKVKEEKPEVKKTDTPITTSNEEWEVLFDGSSFEGWHFYNAGDVTEPWKLEDGTMVFYPPKEKIKGVNYNIVSDREYTNFVLTLEWKVSEAGNSGIFWGIFEDKKYEHPFETGPEIQVLDDEGHPDAKVGMTHRAGALYDMVAPSKDVTRPAGSWNKLILTVNHKTNEGSVVQNGEKIVEFPIHGEGWDAMVANSKFATWEGFGKYATGKIGLQDHGDTVAYRNIKIKKI